MNIDNLAFYPAIIFLGLYSSYTDIRFKRIRNKHIILASLFGLLIYAFLFFTKNIELSRNLILNLLIGLTIGFLFYLTETWNAGDTKLFFAYCLLMPTSKYSKVLIFPSLAVFANIFLVGIIILLFLDIARILKDRKEFLSKLVFKTILFNLGIAFLIIFSLGWLVSFISRPLISRFASFLGAIILYLIYFFIYQAIKKSGKNYFFFLILGAAGIIRFLVHPGDFSLSSIFNYLGKTILYTVVFYLISIILDLNRDNKDTIPFAPLMFLGVLLTNTDFLLYTMRLLNMLKR